jgi:hypothetical protein
MKFLHHLLPKFGISPGIAQVDLFKRKITLPLSGIVAIDAVVLDERGGDIGSVRRCRGDRHEHDGPNRRTKPGECYEIFQRGQREHAGYRATGRGTHPRVSKSSEKMRSITGIAR